MCAPMWIKSTDFYSKLWKIPPEQLHKLMWSRFPPFVLICRWALTVWSTLTGLDWRSKRGLLLAFRNQALASYTITQSICFIWETWRGEGGGGANAIKRQSPKRHCCSPIQWPGARRASESQLWRRMSDCSCKCLRRTVKEGWRASVWEWPVLLRGKTKNAQRSLGAQWARIQVHVIAGWIWDRLLRQMRIRATLWSEDQEAFTAWRQWLVVTEDFSLQTFSSSLRMLNGDLPFCGVQGIFFF